MAFHTREPPPSWQSGARAYDHLRSTAPLEWWAMVPAGRNRKRNRSHWGSHDGWAGPSRASIERSTKRASPGQPMPFARCNWRHHVSSAERWKNTSRSPVPSCIDVGALSLILIPHKKAAGWVERVFCHPVGASVTNAWRSAFLRSGATVVWAYNPPAGTTQPGPR